MLYVRPPYGDLRRDVIMLYLDSRQKMGGIAFRPQADQCHKLISSLRVDLTTCTSINQHISIDKVTHSRSTNPNKTGLCHKRHAILKECFNVQSTTHSHTTDRQRRHSHQAMGNASHYRRRLAPRCQCPRVKIKFFHKSATLEASALMETYQAGNQDHRATVLQGHRTLGDQGRAYDGNTCEVSVEACILLAEDALDAVTTTSQLRGHKRQMKAQIQFCTTAAPRLRYFCNSENISIF